jgi:hypothetical protein
LGRHPKVKPDLTLAELREITELACTLPAIPSVLADEHQRAIAVEDAASGLPHVATVLLDVS